MNGLLLYVGSSSRRLVEHMGGMSLLGARAVYYSLTPPLNLKAVVDQLDYIGIRSLLIVGVTAIFVGMVTALQAVYALSRFGAGAYVGAAVALSVVKQMGPVLTALMVGGRVGSGIAAELGSMAVTEQVDALRAMGANPIKVLVVPRLLACVISFPLLGIVADVLGISGGLIISLVEVPDSFYLYFSMAGSAVAISDFVEGMIKTFVFGLIVALAGCYYGLTTTGGTRGVGLATTVTVVAAFILILVADFFLTKLFLIM